MTKQKTPQHETWNRFEKLDFLLDTCSAEFKDTLLDKIVCSMTDREFADTYEYICTTEGVARDYDELDQLAESDSVFEPQLD
jgi:hypothetical protein